MIQNFTKKHRGFTLVELLVVIAIIGLLSTIVLVSFGPVRNQAKDTAIKANMSQIRLAAEIEYNETSPSTYADTDLRTDYKAAKAAIVATGGSFLPADPDTAFLASAYCIQHTLATSGSWCIDSTGAAGTSPIVCDAAAGADCIAD